MKKILLAVFIVIAIAFLSLGIYYITTPAGSLYHQIPGYNTASTHRYIEHGTASIIIALSFAVLAWFYGVRKVN
ncbi:MAG TPA: hypothetical protein VMV24_02375 [Candidatus Dormibacteraeota bacterium]|nr:hypothetical protein [Candidatus Dormibacteraeota bacterium]